MSPVTSDIAKYYSSSIFPTTRDHIDVTGVRPHADKILATKGYTVVTEYEANNELYFKCVLNRKQNRTSFIRPEFPTGYNAVTIAMAVDRGNEGNAPVMLELFSLDVTLSTKVFSFSARLRQGSVVRIDDNRDDVGILFFLKFDKRELLPLANTFETSTITMGFMPYNDGIEDCHAKRANDGSAIVSPNRGKLYAVYQIPVVSGKHNTMVFTAKTQCIVQIGKLVFTMMDKIMYVRIMASGADRVPVTITFEKYKEDIHIQSQLGLFPAPVLIRGVKRSVGKNGCCEREYCDCAIDESRGSSGYKLIEPMKLPNDKDKRDLEWNDLSDSDDESSVCDAFCGCNLSEEEA